MIAYKQNPGGQAGASRNQLGGWLHFSLTTLNRQEQTPACHFLPAIFEAPSCFGERCHD